MNMNKFFSLILCILIAFSCSDDSNQLEESSKSEIEKRQQWNEGEWWTPCEAANLIVFVDPCYLLPARADALAGINAAIANFNNVPNVGINVTLVFTDPPANGDEIDVRIECNDNLIQSISANGTANEFGGDLIQIDTDEPGTAGCPVNVCFHTNTVMHEFGHILGFGHSQDGSDGTLIPGTTVTTNSVFVGGDCNSDICEFSAGDIIALQSQYPCDCSPLRHSEGYGFFCEIGEIKTFCAPSTVDIREWEIPSNLDLISTDGNCITVQVNNLNTVTNLIAHLDNNSCGFKYTFEINTFEIPNFDISWNDPVCLGDVVTFTISPITPQNLSVIQWNIVGGKLNIMSSNSNFAVVEALSSGTTTICATVINDCGNTHEYCRIVTIRSDRDCGGGDGELPNPK